MNREDHTEEESTSIEEEPLPQLAPPPEARGIKRKREEEEYDSNDREKQRLRTNIKSMFVSNPQLRKQVGQHSEIDEELSPLTLDQLKAMCNECYALCASGTQPHDPFSTGRAITTIIGTFLEKATGLHGLCQRIANDQRLVARVHEIAPFDAQKYGPYFEAFSSLLSHGVNHFHQQQWSPIPTSSMPQPSATSSTPPESS